MLLMKDFWVCGAAVAVLDLEAQLMLSSERRAGTEANLLALLGIPSQAGVSQNWCFAAVLLQQSL